jgi:hypothetical protein
MSERDDCNGCAANDALAEKIMYMVRDAVRVGGMHPRDAVDVLLSCMLPVIYTGKGTKDEAIEYVTERSRELWAQIEAVMGARPSDEHKHRMN